MLVSQGRDDQWAKPFECRQRDRMFLPNELSVLNPSSRGRHGPSSRPSLFLLYECGVIGDNYELTVVDIYENLWCNVRSPFQATPNGH